jgi:alkanesulfonate monooxygenase
MHPYAAAQRVCSLAHLYGRPIDLNFVAGGFKFDLAALDDRLAHDARYERLAEYATIFTRLVAGERISVQGRYYTVFGLQLAAHAPEHLRPRLTMSGASPAGLICAGVVGATAVMYPKPLAAIDGGVAPPGEADVEADVETGPLQPIGIRIGLLARDTDDAAWRLAAHRFPDDPVARRWTQTLARASDSAWLHQLSALVPDHSVPGRDVYWTGPFASGKSFCPYLVGSHERVAAYLSGYLRQDVRAIILDCPDDEEDLLHAQAVLQRATSGLVRSSA